mgnify:CR=1 FL=1
MQETYAGGLIYYFLYVVPLTFVIAVVFFLLGLGVGWLVWRKHQQVAEEIEAEHARLQDERASLQKTLGHAEEKRSERSPETC